LSTPYPQYPPQPGDPMPGQGGSAIAVTTKFFPMSFIFLLVKPVIEVDGYPGPQGRWGRTVLPVAPGQHQVHVHTPYFLPSRVGPADVTVPVAPGQTVELEYRAPAWAFSAGSLGPPPQKYNGMWVLWVSLGILALVIICCCGSLLFSTASNHG
jgi:hypothetical protein